MAEYVAPVKDMQFVLKHVVGLDQVNKLPGWEEVTEDLVDPILEEAAKMASEVLSPLNTTGFDGLRVARKSTSRPRAAG